MQYKKVLSIISFVLVLLALFAALITDFVLFKDAILAFIGGVIASIFIFVVLLVAMVASIIFIFGIFLIEEYGFWPLTLTIEAFKDILNDIVITSDQISTFKGLRFVFLTICIITLIMSAGAKHKEGKEKVPSES